MKKKARDFIESTSIVQTCREYHDSLDRYSKQMKYFIKIMDEYRRPHDSDEDIDLVGFYREFEVTLKVGQQAWDAHGRFARAVKGSLDSLGGNQDEETN